MEEQKATLKRAIAALPSYEAPLLIWNNIELSLEEDQKDLLVQEAIPRLAHYEPAGLIWENIENKLAHSTKTKIVSLANWRQWTSVAAGLLILLTLGYTLWPANQSTASYSAYTEPMDQYLLEADWDADEATFAQVVKMYDDYSKTFEDAESRGLKAELQELNEARKELKTAINLYGNDHELIRQLAALERDRTQVIKKMAFKI